MPMIYFEEDSDPSLLIGRQIGIIGYAALGRSLALNLRESGATVLVSVHGAGQNEAAEVDGMPIATAATVAERSDVIWLTLPDEIMPSLYMESVSPQLKRGDTLLFSSAYNVAFGYIEPPPFVDVSLIAPRAHGTLVRKNFVDGAGTLSFVAVAQDASRNAWSTLLALAGATGLLRTGGVEISIEQEAELNLFVQQAVIPAFHHIMITAANLLMRSGYPAEAALTDLYISGKFNDYLAQGGQIGLLETITHESLIEQYATFSRMDRFKELKLERLMEVTLEEIQNRNFAKEWEREYADGYPRLNKLRKFHESLDVWEWEKQTLELLGDER